LSKFQRLKQSIRLAKNWKKYKQIKWATLDLNHYTENITHRESIHAVDESILADKHWYVYRFLFNALFELKRYQKFKENLKRSVETKANWVSFYKLGLLFFSLEDYGEAKDAFKKSIELKPSPNSYQGLGWSLLKLENRSIQNTTINIGIFGDQNHPAYSNSYQAFGYASIGDYWNKDAIEAFEESLNLKEVPERFLELGLSYLHINQYSQAIDALTKSMSFKKDWRTYYAYGIAHHRLKINGRSNQTIDAYKKASKLTQNWRIFYDLGRALENTKQYTSAISAYKKSLTLAKQPPKSLYYHLGSVYCKSNQYSEAIEVLRKCNKGIKKNDRAYRELGWAFLKVKNHKSARNSFLKSLLMRQHWSAYRGLGNALFELKQYSLAKYCIRRSAHLELGSQGKAFCDLGWLFFKQKEYQSAIKEFKKSIEINPNATAYRGLGSTLMRLKEYHHAKNALEKSISISKEWKTYRDLGLALLHLESYEEAIKMFKVSISIEKNDDSSKGIDKAMLQIKRE